MSLGKRSSGLLLVGLGAIGMVICVAGIAGLWIGATHLQRINSQLFSQVDRCLLQVDERATQARDAVGDARDLVAALREALRERATGQAAERIASLPRIENLEQRLLSAMGRTGDLVESTGSMAEFAEQLLDTIDGIASAKGIDLQSSADLLATIRSARESLADASERLGDVERRLAEFRQKRDVEVDLSEVAKILLGMVAKLDVCQMRIAAFRSRLDEAKTRSAQLENKIRRWILAGQYVILFLIVWVGAGQLCLQLQGRRLLQPR